MVTFDTIITITGGRLHRVTPQEFHQLRGILKRLYEVGTVVVRCGGAAGVDTDVFRFITERTSFGEPVIAELWVADWDRFGRFGPDNAGARRNRAMLIGNAEDIITDRSTVLTHGRKSDLLVKFKGNNGTADCVRQAGEQSVDIERIS
jgi:hypothetical protein